MEKCGTSMDVLKVGGMDISVPDMMWTDTNLQPFLDAVSQSEEGKQILEEMKTLLPGVPYDSESGVTKDHSDYVKEWVIGKKKLGYRSISVLFDYDRTLTVVEGTDLSKLDQFQLEPFIEYHLGGKQRVAMLRDLFTFLYNQGVHLYVLTNNGQCAHDTYSDKFKEVVEYIFNPYPVTIICGQRWRGHKQNAAAAVLPSVCRLDVKSTPYVKNNSRVMYANNGNENNENTSEEAIRRQLEKLKGGKSKKKTRRSKKGKSKSKTRKH